MTQQSLAEVQRRRTITTLGFLGALLIAAGLAVFSGPGATQVAPEPAPAARPPARPVATAPAKPAAAAAKPAPAKPAPPLVDEKVIWDDPPEWKRLASSGMRYASYEIPAAKGDKLGGELNVFILGGDVEANIQRWVDEFSNFDLKSVVRTRRKVNDMQQAIVEIPDGHFSGGMGETKESDNYGLLGAIVVAPSGAEFFFKLTAPSKTIKAAHKPFYKLLDSVRVEKGAAPAASAKPAEPAPAQPAPAQPAPAQPAPAPSAASSASAAPQP
jgi:hypothetical protein